jgi:hypothetical protein
MVKTYIHQQCGPYRSYSYMIKLKVDVARSLYSYEWVRFACRDATRSLTYVGSVLTMIHASGEWEYVCLFYREIPQYSLFFRIDMST